MSSKFPTPLIALICSIITACSSENETGTPSADENSSEIQIVKYLDENALANNSSITREDFVDSSTEKSNLENKKNLIGFINKHLSFYFNKNYEPSSDSNHFVVTGPLINSLPLLSLAAAGETKAQVDEHIPSYQIPDSLRAENKYEWQQDTVVNIAFLKQIEAIIQPTMERLIYSRRSTHLVLEATSSYKSNFDFDENNFNYTPFQGRYIKDGSAYRANMIKLSGDVVVIKTPLYHAKQIELGNEQNLLTLITPHDDQFDKVINQLESIFSSLLSEMKEVEPSPDLSIVVPVISMSDESYGFNWIKEVNMPLAFSEQEANLTSMGFGGFYFDRAMEGNQSIKIDTNGISVKGEHSQYIYGSEENNFFSDSWSAGWTMSAYNDAINGLVFSPTKIEPFEPDFKPSILLLHDSEGHIQAATVIKKLDGNFIGIIASDEASEF